MTNNNMDNSVKNCTNCQWYEEKVSDEYYIPEKDDYTWWWYDYCAWRQAPIDDTEDVCIQYKSMDTL